MMPEGLEKIKSARILVVEDSLANQTLAHDLLKHAGCHVDLAGNGMEAIKAIQAAAEPYDAVLMDLQMPIMDGLEATAFIRKELSLESLPIIATTASAGKRDQLRCMAAGASDYLLKPFHINELYDVMIRWVQPGDGKVGPTIEDESISAMAATADTSLPIEMDGIDIVDGLRRVGQNGQLYAGLLIEFSKTNALLEQEIGVAFNAGDLQRVRFLAHGIRSTAGNIGADALSNAAAVLEEQAVDDGGDTAQAVKNFLAELERVISAIAKSDIVVRRGPAPRTAGEKPFDRDEAEMLIGTLLNMLDDQDLGAQRELENLAAILGGRGHDDMLEHLSDNLEALDFSNARHILTQAGKDILG